MKNGDGPHFRYQLRVEENGVRPHFSERDVRSVAAIRDLAAFRRFLGLLAARSGQILNRSELAAPLGLSVPTVSAGLFRRYGSLLCHLPRQRLR